MSRRRLTHTVYETKGVSPYDTMVPFHCVTVTARARVYSVLGVRAYGLRGENRDYVPANQRRGVGVVHNQCRRPDI